MCNRLSNRLPWSFILSANLLLLFFLAVGPAQGVDQTWKTVSVGGQDYEVHVVSDSGVGGGFPNRELDFAADGSNIRDIYVVDTSTGSALPIPNAMNLVTLVQSSFKTVATNPGSLFPETALPLFDIQSAGAPYGLWTSAYFSNFFIDSFIRAGAEGIDDPDDREELYAELLFDACLQPELADDPSQESRYQTMLDRSLRLGNFLALLDSGASTFENGNADNFFDYTDYVDAVFSLASEIRSFYDLQETPTRGPGLTPLDQLHASLSILGDVSWITGKAARLLLLETMAQERGLARIAILKQMILRLDSTRGADSALVGAIFAAEQKMNDFVDGYYTDLPSILSAAFLEDPSGILRVVNYSKFAVKAWLGTSAATTYSHVAMPYILSYKTFQGIRAQADRARTASLAATLQREFFDPAGLEFHRAAMDSGGTLIAEEGQKFFDLYQMSWYLANRHYRDALETLNNRLSRIWGAGIDFFQGDIYSEQMEDLRNSLERTAVIAQRINGTTYLATNEDFSIRGNDAAEGSWLLQLVRGSVVPSPSAPPVDPLGLCITLPFDPAGTPATNQGMNVRFEPRDCSSPPGSGSWECGNADPDDECRARVQLYWDDDQNPNNADCDNGSGPCPIAGAEDLNPKRSPFLWTAAKDGLVEGGYYLFARLTLEGSSVETYSDGFYEFIDPRFEAGHWSVVGVETEEGGFSDGDGIPEIGEEAEISLLLRNDSGRSLTGVVVDQLRLEGEPVRHLVTSAWNQTTDPEVSYILDGEVPVPDAGTPSQIVATSDSFDFWVGTDTTSTTIDLVASVEYWDFGNPDRPDLRRIQEIGFPIQVSDGTTSPSLRCDHTDIVGDTDSDGVFESGERGEFTVTLCNDGTWEARQVRGIFRTPPPFGEWSDEDAPFPDLNPTECQESTDDYALRTEPSECGPMSPTLDVEYDGGLESGLVCSLSVACVPFQSIQDDKDLGTAPQGDPIVGSISISNIGSANLSISSVVEQSGAPEVGIVFPPLLAPGTGGTIDLTIDTTELDPGLYTRTIVVTSDANNTDERQSDVTFGVAASGGAPEQLTTTAVSGSLADLSGNLAVFERSSDIYVIDINSRVETRLTETGDREYKPRISGNYVVFVRDDGDPANANVILADLTSRSETPVTNLAAKQTDPDIDGTRIIWVDERPGALEADVYKYDIGVSSINGELHLSSAGSRRALDDPRIDGGYVAAIEKFYFDPADDFTFRRDIRYRRPDGTEVSLGLAVPSPSCRTGNRMDIDGNRLAFECDSQSDAENDDYIYGVDMNAGSGPAQLTCDLGPGDDREDPSFDSEGILYQLDGAHDIYRVAFSASSCQTEIPLQIGAQNSEKPAGDPDGEAYVFFDDRTGSRQLWGVIPPPPVEIAVTSVYFDTTEWLQNRTYDVHADVLNNGTDAVSSIPVRIEAAGELVHEETISTLAAGASATIDGVWTTPSSSTGSITVTAFLNPPPAGDADAGNDTESIEVLLEDDDTSPPVLSALQVSPGPGDDGDVHQEDDEDIFIQWTASDPAGIASSEAVVGGVSFPGSTSRATENFSVTVPALEPGIYPIEIYATDADDSPEATTSPLLGVVEVYPAFPEIVFRDPSPGATDADPREPVRVGFSADMDSGSFTPETVELELIGLGSVPAVLSYDSPTRILTLQPSGELEAESDYRVTISGGSGGVRDVRQNVLPADDSWDFTTIDIADLVFVDGFESGDTTAWGN